MKELSYMETFEGFLDITGNINLFIFIYFFIELKKFTGRYKILDRK